MPPPYPPGPLANGSDKNGNGNHVNDNGNHMNGNRYANNNINNNNNNGNGHHHRRLSLFSSSSSTKRIPPLSISDSIDSLPASSPSPANGIELDSLRDRRADLPSYRPSAFDNTAPYSLSEEFGSARSSSAPAPRVYSGLSSSLLADPHEHSRTVRVKPGTRNVSHSHSASFSFASSNNDNSNGNYNNNDSSDLDEENLDDLEFALSSALSLPWLIWALLKRRMRRFARILRSMWAGQLLAWLYLRAETNRERRSFSIGMFTVLLVVAIILLIQNNLLKAPIIFLKLSEDSVGEYDAMLFPSASAGITAVYNSTSGVAQVNLPFLNETRIESATKDVPSVIGAASRWLLLSSLSNPNQNDADRTRAGVVNSTSAIVLAFNGEHERSINLGRAWDKPALVPSACYLSRSVARQLGYDLTVVSGQNITLQVDLLDLASELGISGSSLVSVASSAESSSDSGTGTGNGGTGGGTGTGTGTGTDTGGSSSSNNNSSVPLTRSQLLEQSVKALVNVFVPGLPSDFWTRERHISFNGTTLGPLVLMDVEIGSINIPLPAGTNLSALSLNQTITYDSLLQLILPTLDSLTRTSYNLTISDIVDEPQGKWPQALGSVIVLETSTFSRILSSSLLNVLNADLSILDLGNVTIPANFTIGNVTIMLPQNEDLVLQFQPISVRTLLVAVSPDSAETLSAINAFANETSKFNADESALISIVSYADRLTAYVSSLAGMRSSMQSFTNDLYRAMGVRAGAGIILPLYTALSTSITVRYFLESIFNSVIAVILVLAILLVYSLLLNDVDSKTYEYGMLRALGMPNRTLVQVLITKALFFAVPGILFGFLIAFLLNMPVAGMISDFALVPVTYAFYRTPITVALLIGLVMPLVANVVPISRALGRTLRDSLDVYHHVVSDVVVRMQKLAEFGLDLWQAAISVLLVVMGFVTFYLVPYSFIYNNIPLFLGIFNAILLGMLFGLCLTAQVVQPYVERLILRLILLVWHRKLYNIVRKNMLGHAKRNAKTASMFTLCLAFVIFAGVMFALQSSSIAKSVKLVFAADLSVQVTDNRNIADALDRPSMSRFLDSEIARRKAGDRTAVVVDYTFITFPLVNVPGVDSFGFSALPGFQTFRNRVYGISENFLDVTYPDLYQPTEFGSSTGPWPRVQGTDLRDVIKVMFTDAGRATLPEERDGIRVPQTLDPRTSTTNTMFVQRSSTQQYAALNQSYTKYIDVVIGEALRGSASITVNTPLSIFVQGTGEGSHSFDSLCKARGMVSKMPGFLYSSYSVAASISATLMREEQFQWLLNSTLPAGSPYVGDRAAPVQRLLVRVTDDATADQRIDVLNGLRTFFSSSGIVVTDTRDVLQTARSAFDLLQLLFQVVGVIAMIMCFFILLLSFTANVTENAWEFGVLRALGLNTFEVIMVYVYEALSLIVAAVLIATTIGVSIAASLTLQYNLFVEFPFEMDFPYGLFWSMFVMALVVSVGGSAWPAYQMSKHTVSNILRRQ